MKPTFPCIAEIIDTHGLVEIVEEIRLRTWTRLNYAAPEERDDNWPRLYWKKWTAKTSKSRFSDLNRVPLLASPTGRRTTREHV